MPRLAVARPAGARLTASVPPQTAKPPVLTPVRHTRKRQKSLDSTPGQLALSMPTAYDARVPANNIRLQGCVMEGIADFRRLQQRHRLNSAEYQCVLAPA